MKAKIRTLLLLTMLNVALASCDKPYCRNTNPYFDMFPSVSDNYKKELAKQLHYVDRSKLTYWFKEYVEKDGIEQLHCYIQGDGLCAIIVLDVEQWDKLEDLRQKKGKTYKGTQFTDLQFDIQKEALQTKFIFRDFGQMIR